MALFKNFLKKKKKKPYNFAIATLLVQNELFFKKIKNVLKNIFLKFRNKILPFNKNVSFSIFLSEIIIRKSQRCKFCSYIIISNFSLD